MNSITVSGQDNSVWQTVHVCWQLTVDYYTIITLLQWQSLSVILMQKWIIKDVMSITNVFFVCFMENCKNVYLKSNTRVKGRGTMYLYLPQTYVRYYFVILAQKSEMKSRLP